MQNAHSLTTTEVLAEQHGVDESTIRRDEWLAGNVEVLGIEDETDAGKAVAPKAESLKRDAETVNVYSRIGIGKDGPPKATCDKLSQDRLHLVTRCHETQPIDLVTGCHKAVRRLSNAALCHLQRRDARNHVDDAGAPSQFVF
ncbi:MAG TPA: hypothetical protein DDZ51_15545 [Planctomycetaceae bacterium]|nr:hypothetical protein [Planctomycetaceae bacterium]